MAQGQCAVSCDIQSEVNTVKHLHHNAAQEPVRHDTLNQTHPVLIQFPLLHFLPLSKVPYFTGVVFDIGSHK